MRRISTTIIFSLTILNTSIAQAKTATEREEPRQEAQELDFHPDIFPHLILQPVYMFLELNLHEGNHALTTLALGQEVVSYRLYSHYEDVGGERTLYFGSTEVSDAGMTARKDAVIIIMPTVVDAMVFISSDLALSNMERGSRFAPFILFGGMVWPCIDFTMNVNSFYPASDVSRWSESVGVNRYCVSLVGNEVSFVGFCLILEQSATVLLAPKAKSPNKTSLLVQPVVTSDGATLALIGRF